MKIVVLGTNGFLSSAIAEHAIRKEWELNTFGMDSPQTYQCSNFHRVDLMVDTIDYTQLYDADMIIYAIGAGIQANLNDGIEAIYRLNLITPIQICRALQVVEFNGVFITFGSYFELGEARVLQPATEQEIIYSRGFAPTDYILSKRLLTKFVSSYKPSFTHWHFILPTIFGAKENRNRIIPYTIKSILESGYPHFTTGNQVRQYLHVCNIPKIIERAYSYELKSGVYNIQGKETLTIKELVMMIYGFFNQIPSPDVFGEITRSDTSMPYLALNGEKLFDKIPYIPRKTITESINDYLECY
jgi:nucleoside-diphosphate-sugar epimerase